MTKTLMIWIFGALIVTGVLDCVLMIWLAKRDADQLEQARRQYEQE